MKKPIATIVAAAGILAALADTSTNTGAAGSVTPEKKYPWESSVSAGLTVTSGNSDTVLATLALATARKTPDNEYSLGADFAYGKANSVKNLETYHAFGQWNHLFSDRVFSYVRGDVLRDTIADLRYRVTLSPGAGYYFIKQENTTFAGEVGPGVVFRDLGGKRETFATLRLAERFEHKFSPGTRVWESAEFLPQVDRFKNYIVNAELGAEAAFTKSLSLQVVLSDSYNSEPALGRKRNDVKLVSGVSYKF
jgi:putative salt-induced outer membrane protein YdiY